MKKFVFVLILVLLLASCAQSQSAVENISDSPDVTATSEITQTPALQTALLPSPSPSPMIPIPSPTPSPTIPIPSPSPSPTVTITPKPSPASIHYSDDEKVSETVTIGDLKKYCNIPPEELLNMLGEDADILGYVDDIDAYVAGWDSLNITIHYTCDFEDAEIPKLPVKRIRIHDFKFCGLNERSTFEDVMNTLGEAKVQTRQAEDAEYYCLRYKINGFWFEFAGSDKKGSDGVSLEIVP